MLPSELYSYFVGCYGEPKPAPNRVGFRHQYLGELYVRLQFDCGITTRSLVEIFPVDVAIRAYLGLHDLGVK